MISIVICSVDQSNLRNLTQSIEKTIGVLYELIVINNAIEKKSLSAAYNTGIRKANYELICFIHEDVVFRTDNWGQVLIDIFSDDKIGLAGIAGSYYYSLPPISWFGTSEKEMNIIQTQNPEKSISCHLRETRFKMQDTTEVVVIDGVFMATKKNILKEVYFDERLLDDFHGYDTDFSLQILQSHKIVVTKRILIEHFSTASLDQAWFKALYNITKKWKSALPVFLPFYQPEEIRELNKKALWDFYFLSAGYLPRRKRIGLYFYYATKQAILGYALRRFSSHYFKRLLKIT